MLRQFIAVAEELHYGRAAQRVGMAQSPLSTAIQKLEAYLDTPLFERNQRSVALTPAGRAFLDEAYQWLRYEEVAVARTHSVRNGVIGQLMVGFIGSTGYGFMPELVRQFRQEYPQVRLRLIEMTTKDQLERLRGRYIDAGLLRTPLPYQATDIETRLYRYDRLMAALPKAHPLAGRQIIDLRELARESFVAFSRERIPAAHAQLISACASAGFYPDIEQECTQIASIICLVAAGVAVALIPGNLASLLHSDVRYVPLSNDPAGLSQCVSLAWRKGDDNPALASFLKVAGALQVDIASPDIAAQHDDCAATGKHPGVDSG
ncbi:LysR family transcriptional regulator [Verticiella sediminum]|uniref:LysR family transcriptional regulator n=1 Tax=Verticiella sediminum TaxID=1247510 RepID=UPI0031EC1E42